MGSPETGDCRGQIVERDRDHFKVLFTNSPAEMPTDFKFYLDSVTTDELMETRDNDLRAANPEN